MKPNNNDLYNFILRATSATYAGGGSYETVVERPGFLEMVFLDGDWHYRDSYTGFYRSSGSEVVRYQDQIVWVSSYCGGMAKGTEAMAIETFDFLKKAMLAKPKDKQSFRGPDSLKVGEWQYRYEQKGDVIQFTGHEEIIHKGQLLFSHDIIGGLVIDR